jgi:hypothetical protein
MSNLVSEIVLNTGLEVMLRSGGNFQTFENPDFKDPSPQ